MRTFDLRDLEQLLADRFCRKHCVLTGRAASAIHIALRALQLPPGKIVLPAVSCPSPATVTLYSGHQPLFCDISLRDFNMCPESLRGLLADNPDVVAIMPVHLYGKACPLHEIQALADEHGVPVIEDAAQALGASFQGKPLGSMGNISILSFGRTKTIDAGGGGAALTDDDLLAAKLRQYVTELPVRPAKLESLCDEWRRVYYSLTQLAEKNPELHRLFLPLPEIFREMYLYRFSEYFASEITAGLERLDFLVEARRARAHSYRAGLRNAALHHPVLDEEAAPWRYSVLVPPSLRKVILERLRSAKLDASSWYPPLYNWYDTGRKQDPAFFPNASRLANEVINLWVTPDLHPDRITLACRIIEQTLAEHD